MESLNVRDLGHLNQLTDDYTRGVDHMRKFYGAQFFSPIWTPDWEATNCLFLIGATCLELMSPYGSESILGRSLRRQGPGFYGFEFRVNDYHQAKEAVSARDIAIVSDVENRFFWTHPRDTHGILLAILPSDFVSDPRDAPGWDGGAAWLDHPLGVRGLAYVTLAVHSAGAASDFYAELCGGDVVESGELPLISGRYFTVEIAGTRYRFVEPQSDGVLADHLAKRGPGVRSATFAVADLDRVRSWSADTMMPVRQGDEEGTLAVPPVLNLGASYAFTALG
jgi:hypothetical protein